jgi:hypothetical protein
MNVQAADSHCSACVAFAHEHMNAIMGINHRGQQKAHPWTMGLTLVSRPLVSAGVPSGACKVLKKCLAAGPDAGHVRHDDRPARTVFLRIGGTTHPNRIRTWIVAGVNILRLGLIAGVNANPPRRAGGAFGWTCGQIVWRQRLRNARALWRGLRFRAGRQQRESGYENPGYRQFADTHYLARPVSVIALRSPIAGARSTIKADVFFGPHAGDEDMAAIEVDAV